MQINREFWSGNTRKITDNDNSTIVEFLDNSLYTDITANPTKYRGVEWDKSVTPWKINANSDFFNMNFMLGWDTDYHETVKVAQSRLFKERKKGFPFYISSNGNNNISGAYGRMFPCWLATLSRPELDLTDTYVNARVQDKFKELHPIINFDYSRIFAVPFLQRKNYGNRQLFSESLRNNWDAANYSGWGVAFYYHDNTTTFPVIDLGLDIVSLNSRFNIPDWDTTNCFESEQFDNGLSVISYGYQNSTLYWRAQLGQRYQVDASESDPGTLFDQSYQSSADAAGAVQYYPNRLIWINGTENTEIYQSNYIAGNLQQSQYRTFERTLNPLLTFDDFKEYLGTQLAYLGFRFSLDGDTIRNNTNSEYFFIPEINDSGVTTGNYYAANSMEAAQLINYDWSTDVYNVTPYDGTDDEEDGDPNIYDDSNTTILNPLALVYSSKFQNYYVLSSAGLQDVTEYLYSDLPTAQPKTDFLTDNPIDCVVSIMMFPFLVDKDMTQLNPIIYFGKVKAMKNNTTEVIASGYIKGQVQEIDCGECVYYPDFGVEDFRSYEPYCDAELILPYCGSVKLSPTAIYCKTTERNFHKIGVKYIVDVLTGACIGCVYLDNLLIETVNGQIGMTVPVTGIKSADLERDITYRQAAAKQAQNTALSSLASAVVGTVNGIVSAGMSPNPVSIGNAALSTVNNVLSYDSAEENYKTKLYDLQHIQTPFSVRGSASPMCDFRNEQFPRLLIKRPVMLDYEPEVYAHSVGYACLITGKLSDYGAETGENPQYIEATGLDMTGFGGTEAERIRLKSVLEGGIYL